MESLRPSLAQSGTSGTSDGLSRRDLAQMPLRKVRGLSVGFVEKCAKAGLESVEDLLTLYPRRYIDRSRQVTIGELFPGDEATFYATVEAISSRRMRNRRMMVEAVVADATSRIKVTFFNQPWRMKQLKVGTQAAFFGKMDEYRGNPQIVNPTVDVIRESDDDAGATIIPVYPQNVKADLSTWQIRRNMSKILSLADNLDEFLDDEFLGELKLVGRVQAFRQIHQPESENESYQAARRLRFDEFLMLQMVLVSRFLSHENLLESVELTDSSLQDEFVGSLPFELTGSQREAINEISEDMSSKHPMHRLLQGDVGSGKTVVAFAAAMRAVGSGGQVIIMAPTEVLAQQHYTNAQRMLSSLSVGDESSLFTSRPVNVELLSNSTSAKERSRIEQECNDGHCDVLISTHAVLYTDWVFKDLVLVVVDEQHRFGVEQRAALLSRSSLTPHLLVMTATPIPRTAAMLYFGDLHNTIMKDMPDGRQPVKTKWAKTDLEVYGAYETLRGEVAKGYQAFVVCPLVNESDKLEAKSVVDHYEYLRSDVLKGCEVGLVHGQMSSSEKEEVMGRFISGEIDVLVSTTVIEVGVDVPNTTVMVVEDADRFGLSQLHQLRGRVGRGGAGSYCFLCSDKDSVEVTERLSAMEKTSDGFELAEIDLALRGSGHVLGEVQSGRGDLLLGRLPRDRKYVEHARDVALKILTDDPTMESERHQVLAREVAYIFDEYDVGFLFKS